jgi:hypothetical protein
LPNLDDKNLFQYHTGTRFKIEEFINYLLLKKVKTLGNPNPDPDPFGNNGYKKCKLCGGNSDCPGSTCASGIPYCSDSSKRCL